MTRAPKKAVKERKVWSFARLEARRDTETTRVVIYMQESLSRGAAASQFLNDTCSFGSDRAVTRQWQSR